MFHGRSSAKLDNKGRLKIPSDFRRAILDRYGEGGFYVTSLKGDCARVYPERAWDDVIQKLKTQPASSRPIQKFQRLTGYYGKMATMDPQGRVLIHPDLREATGLEGDVIVLGRNTYLEVWDHKRFKEVIKEDLVEAEDEDYYAKIDI